MRENNHLDFTGQKFFVGIDNHNKSWTVTIRNNQIHLKTFSMNPFPDELSIYMHRHYPGGSTKVFMKLDTMDFGFIGSLKHWVSRI